MESSVQLVVGVLKLDLLLHSSFNLKDKRKVLRSLIDRVKAKFPVSIAEVGENDIWGRSHIGVAIVSNDSQFANTVLNKVIDLVEGMGLVEIANAGVEILNL